MGYCIEIGEPKLFLIKGKGLASIEVDVERVIIDDDANHSSIGYRAFNEFCDYFRLKLLSQVANIYHETCEDGVTLVDIELVEEIQTAYAKYKNKLSVDEFYFGHLEYFNKWLTWAYKNCKDPVIIIS